MAFFAIFRIAGLWQRETRRGGLQQHKPGDPAREILDRWNQGTLVLRCVCIWAHVQSVIRSSSCLLTRIKSSLVCFDRTQHNHNDHPHVRSLAPWIPTASCNIQCYGLFPRYVRTYVSVSDCKLRRAMHPDTPPAQCQLAANHSLLTVIRDRNHLRLLHTYLLNGFVVTYATETVRDCKS